VLPLYLDGLRRRLPPSPLTSFAPRPTGFLHVGHGVNALFVWGLARALGGRYCCGSACVACWDARSRRCSCTTRCFASLSGTTSARASHDTGNRELRSAGGNASAVLGEAVFFALGCLESLGRWTRRNWPNSSP